MKNLFSVVLVNKLEPDESSKTIPILGHLIKIPLKCMLRSSLYIWSIPLFSGSFSYQFKVGNYNLTYSSFVIFCLR